ncbi:MAG TPA: DNA polymerase III subunit gamma/tau [Candidatus Moranbacteria bacterium]|nr:DNA polymerase III subunit gamma/tau [Candidatus Moranbacteria bacterium]HQB59405.1 DNA polymerase III subunit gamma/tau [Candidatus Moranbacteria bacterium]
MTSLYRKYRPQTFSDVIGQTHIVQTLSNAIKHGKIGHAYLFTGPRGTGKTTLARIFAQAINCAKSDGANPCLKCDACKNTAIGKSLDIFEIDAASNTGVDNIRELRENVKLPPTYAKYKVYIIDEVHMLSTGAFNALLKTLEEPPAHVIFILATTEIHKVPETIISRCQRYDFGRLSINHITKKLSFIAKKEEVEIEKDALEMIAISAEGGMRDAESLLSQVMALEDKKITAKEVEGILGTTRRQSLEKMADFLFLKDVSGALGLVNEISREGYDLDVFNKSLLNYLRQAMLLSVSSDLLKIFSHELTNEQAKSLAEKANGRNPKEILSIIECFAEAQGKIRSAFIPQLSLEMAIIKALANTESDEKSVENSLKSDSSPQKSPTSPNINQQGSQDAPISPSTAKSEVMPAPEKKPEIKQNMANQKPDKMLETENGPKISLQEVKKCWNQAVFEIKALNHSLSAILQSCQPVKTENGILSIAAKFPFHKDKLNERSNRLTLESVFAKILGLKISIKTITNEEAGIKKTTSSKVSATITEEKPKKTSSLLSDAMGILGGQIIE